MLKALLLTLAASALALESISICGNQFCYPNGTIFSIHGIAYQRDASSAADGDKFVDPLADPDGCRRDIPYLQQLSTNVVRVYALSASKSHSQCMEMMADAGIYVIADLASPTESIITNNPSWTLDLYDRYRSVIDEMSQYDNMLGYFAGNEVITNSTTSDAAPFIKAAVRDVKSYISSHHYRQIPVGYSANDDAATRVASAEYFACGESSISADFYGINMYEWCGDSSFRSSGYEQRTREFSKMPVPVFFSEYGCNKIRPRKFTEVGTLFSGLMSDTWAGGIVYMYFEEENKYGLVSTENETVQTLEDFDNLKEQMDKLTTNPPRQAKDTTTQLTCPAISSNWHGTELLPPTPDGEVCGCLKESLKCVVDDSVREKDYGALFSTVCGLVDCREIETNSTAGYYGAFSFCTAKEKLSYALNEYYETEGERRTACDFDGQASLVKSRRPSAGCADSINSARRSAARRETSDEVKSNAGRLTTHQAWMVIVAMTAMIFYV